MKFDRLVLDAVAAVDYLNPSRPTPAALNDASTLVIPLPVLGELRFGALNAAPEWRARVASDLDRFIAACELLFPDVITADFYARIRVEKVIPPNISTRRQIHLLNDLWTAALCIQYQLPLLSNDRDFEGIADLQLIQW